MLQQDTHGGGKEEKMKEEVGSEEKEINKIKVGGMEREKITNKPPTICQFSPWTVYKRWRKLRRYHP